MRVEYHPAVEEELVEIRDFYEAQSPGLGARFVDEFERQVLAIAAAPERWMVVRGDIRRCLMAAVSLCDLFSAGRPDLDLSETMRRAEQTSAADTLKAAAQDLVGFMKSVPRKAVNIGLHWTQR